jgi:hypothetical protein
MNHQISIAQSEVACDDCYKTPMATCRISIGGVQAKLSQTKLGECQSSIVNKIVNLGSRQCFLVSGQLLFLAQSTAKTDG